MAISNRRVYAVVITRLKHRLECCPARAFAPDDQVRMHLKRMDSNHSLARRATPRRRRSLSTALERPRLVRQRQVRGRKLRRGIGGCDENDHFSFDGHKARSEVWQKKTTPEERRAMSHVGTIAELAFPLAVAAVLSAKRRTCTRRASHRLRNLTARGPFPLKNAVFLNL